MPHFLVISILIYFIFLAFLVTIPVKIQVSIPKGIHTVSIVSILFRITIILTSRHFWLKFPWSSHCDHLNQILVKTDHRCLQSWNFGQIDHKCEKSWNFGQNYLRRALRALGTSNIPMVKNTAMRAVFSDKILKNPLKSFKKISF